MNKYRTKAELQNEIEILNAKIKKLESERESSNSINNNDCSELQFEILNSFTSHIAVLNNTGEIIYVNDAWKQFAINNDYKGDNFGVNSNYLLSCNTKGCSAKTASEAFLEISDILSGKKDRCSLEYPCHSPNEARWFQLFASTYQKGNFSGVIVEHINITKRKLAQEKLKESELKNRVILETVQEGVIISDRLFNLTYVNRQITEIMGYSEGEVIGKSVLNFIDESYKTFILQKIENLRKGIPEKFELYIYNKFGEKVYILVAANILTDKDNKLTGYFAMITNITKFKLMEEEITKSRDYYLTLLENFPALILRVDAEGKCNYVNKTWIKFTGLCLDEEMQTNCTGGIHPEDYEKCSEFIRKSFAIRQPFEIEYRLKHNSGDYKWILNYGQPFYDVDGSFSGYINVCYDLTQRKQQEQALKQFRTAMELSGDSIFIIDRNLLKFIDVNVTACNILNYTRSELLKMGPLDIKPLYTKEMLKADFDRTFSSEDKLKRIESKHCKKNGETFPVEVLLRGINSENGDILVAIARDISERKKAEEGIRKSLEKEKELNEMKSRFVSTVSHEYRTPLTSILSSAELLEMFGDKWDRKKRLEFINKIKNAVQFMTSMVNEILFVNSAEAGKLNFIPEDIEINKFCNEIVQEIQINTKSKCKIIYESNRDLINAFLDKKLLKHILTNLLVNAVTYSKEGSIVDFTCSVDINHIIFIIKDYGVGIPESEQKKLFEPFFRGKNVLNIPGTGLGLSIVQKCVETQKGKIFIQSEENSGTKITVRLPLKNQ